MRWSPNQSERPKGTRPFLIVIHSTEGQMEHSVEWLMDPRARASAHFVLGQDGTSKKLVPLSRKAWHVQSSIMFGGYDVNSISIGIELENYRGSREYPPAQLQALAKLVKQLQRVYTIRGIVAHRDLDVKRRTDPVGFPWIQFWSIMGESACPKQSSPEPMTLLKVLNWLLRKKS